MPDETELHPSVPKGTVLPPVGERGKAPDVIPPINTDPPFHPSENWKEGK